MHLLNRHWRHIRLFALAMAGLLVLGVVAAVVWPDPPADDNGATAIIDSPGGRFETHGGDKLPPKPRQAPGAPLQVGWPCEGDGAAGLRVQWIYGYNGADNLASLRASFEQYARNVEGVFLASSGGQLLLRYVTDANCALSIAAVPLSSNAMASFDVTINELYAAGYNRADRKYHVWTEGAAYCGIGTISGDDQPGEFNAANGGPSYSRSDRGCWDYAEVHELTHNLGGVQLTAPNSTGAWHCKDGADVMCYADGGPNDAQVTRCDAGQSRQLDCQDNDYFATAPPEASYLATHWNVARSAYLSSASSPTTQPPPTTVPPTTVPPTTSTTTGQGQTTTVLSLPDKAKVGQDIVVTASVSGACGPTGTVEFLVSDQVMSRQVLAGGAASTTLRFTAAGRFTIRANYLGSAQCAPSSDWVRKRVT